MGLYLEEAALVEVTPDRRDHSRAQLEVRAGLLVHQQVEVALPVARLDVGDAVEGVRERPADLRQQDELGDGQRRLAALRTAGLAGRADDVAEVEVELLLSDQLNPAGAVDEVEKAQLSHRAAGHDAPCDAALALERLAGLGLLGLGPDRGNLFPIGKALRQHPRESIGLLALHHRQGLALEVDVLLARHVDDRLPDRATAERERLLAGVVVRDRRRRVLADVQSLANEREVARLRGDRALADLFVVDE
jgi:hypothetical protein